MKLLLLNMLLWCHGSVYRAREIKVDRKADSHYKVTVQNRVTGCVANMHCATVREAGKIGMERKAK